MGWMVRRLWRRQGPGGGLLGLQVVIVSLIALEGGGIWTFVDVEDGEKDCFEHGGCERYAGAAKAAAMIGLLHRCKI